MTTAILWFRRDLRLTDHAALRAALQGTRKLVPVYVHAPDEEGAWPPGGASRWWLHHSLASLDQSLREKGSRLIVRAGATAQVLTQLARECGATQVHYSRRHEPAALKQEQAVCAGLQQAGIAAHAGDSGLLREPRAILKPDGTPYRVFTAYWRAAQTLPPADVRRAPARLPPLPRGMTGLALARLELLPRVAWDGGLRDAWQPGEAGARANLRRFLRGALSDYARERDRPDHAGTSRLSPHLAFGEVSARQIAAALFATVQGERGAGAAHGAEVYLRQLGWREFACHLLAHFPHTPEQPLDARFAEFAWEHDAEALRRWQRGMTGIPMVDAGMRELWHTGWMHNRVRMIVASFLTKHLLTPWQEGARWFWETLVDADLANNTLGWQWTAGCGADAAPYFRVFNPVLQGEKFDPEGDYVRRWVPELAAIPGRRIHAPWKLAARGDYPPPLIELAAGRARALARFNRLVRGARRKQ